MRQSSTVVYNTTLFWLSEFYTRWLIEKSKEQNYTGLCTPPIRNGKIMRGGVLIVMLHQGTLRKRMKHTLKYTKEFVLNNNITHT